MVLMVRKGKEMRSLEKASAGAFRQKKEEEDATFCLIKDGTFFRLFLSNEPGPGKGKER
jgi:hypothetical protein